MLHNIINDPFKVGRSGTASRLTNCKLHQIDITARKLHELFNKLRVLHGNEHRFRLRSYQRS